MSPGPDLVDWDLAAATGVRLLRPGPEATAAQARAVVGQLRDYALEARGHVRAYTGLDVSGAAAPVAVVDRPAWVRSNVQGLRHLLEPMADRIQSRTMAGMPAPVRAVGSRLTALEAGAGLAFLGGKVLGQYEMFPPDGPDGDRPGRLLLVAPNIVQVERELAVVPEDFRMWVCLHEETHRVQFGAVPWLRGHIVEQVGVLLSAAEDSLSAGAVRERGVDVVAAVAAALRGQPGPSLAEALQSPQQQALLAEVTAVMSLLEGHADVVMDDIGPDVVPTVAQIRTRFQRRREEPGRVEAALRRLLGLDAKLRQYRDGAAFVRAVVDQVGMAAFNRVWESAATLPSAAELAQPDRWIARVVGTPEKAGPGVSGPDPAVAQVRRAVRAVVAGCDPGDLLLVGCSGGADSLALAAALAFEAPKAAVRAGAVVVDHQLQDGSAERALGTAEVLRGLGLDPVEVATVAVVGAGGPEAAARAARYGALDAAADRTGAVAVLLAHTRDDQAETVLLGLARGSGTRSLAGMPPTSASGRYRRPLLDLDRAATRQACAALGLEPWQDPHNADPRFARTRVRHEVLPVLERELGPGVAAALARSAALARADADALDAIASAAAAQVRGPDGDLDAAALADLAPAVRSRVLRAAALAAGCPATDLSSVHVRAMDGLVVDWHGQLAVELPGGVAARRACDRLSFASAEPPAPSPTRGGRPR